MKKILVTGSKGQLGNEMQVASHNYPQFSFIFTDIDELDITDINALSDFVKAHKVDVIVNCAAYTAVDKAETDQDLCYKINFEAVRNIGDVAGKNDISVLHISTDYVFDGTNYIPYTEDQSVCPSSVYGKSKLDGEKALVETCKKAIIIRTSWLYSSFGNNYVKTMRRLGNERESLNVIFDQVGTPTYAADLADAMLKILAGDKFTPGIYHYSNEGVCSWYDFTKSIHRLSNICCNVQPIESKDYPTPTPRPHYSVLNKSKIKSTFNIKIPYWEDSLAKCIEVLEKDS